MNNTVTSTSVLRKQNKNRIFNYIFNSTGEVTKQDISSSLNLSLPTVTQNLQELEKQALIEYSGTTLSTGGRKPRIIDINKNGKCSIGVSVTKNNLRICCANLKLQERCYKKIDVSDIDFAKIGEVISGEVDAFIKEHMLNSEKILGVCIAFPGIISADKNYIENAPTLSLKNFPLKKVYNAVKFPCYIDNDANLGALTEWHTKDNFIYLSVDKGVGGAIMLNQQPYWGNTGKSAEFGHMCIDKNGPVCSCTKRGCLEAFCSTDKISAELGLTIEEFFEKLGHNDKICVNTFNNYLEVLAKGINNIHMIMDCNIIIGGALAQFLKEYLHILKEKVMQTDALNQSANYIKLSQYGSKTTCLGAAFYHVQNFINNI